MASKRWEHCSIGGVLTPPGGLNDVGPIRDEWFREQRFHPEHSKGVRCAAITQHHATPDLQQAVDGGSRIRERDAPVRKDRHSRAGLEVGRSETVVDQVAEGVTRMSRCRSVEVDDQASPGRSGETERSDVEQNRVARPDSKHPEDEVSLSHAPERTKPDEPWEDLDNGGRIT